MAAWNSEARAMRNSSASAARRCQSCRRKIEMSCRRKIEMSPGAQSRDDTPIAGGRDQRDTGSQPDAASGLSYDGR